MPARPPAPASQAPAGPDLAGLAAGLGLCHVRPDHAAHDGADSRLA
jgi:hypothetical protein